MKKTFEKTQKENLTKNLTKMITVNELKKGEKYINPNTGTEMIFSHHFKTDINIFAVDNEGAMHISQTFKNL